MAFRDGEIHKHFEEVTEYNSDCFSRVGPSADLETQERRIYEQEPAYVRHDSSHRARQQKQVRK